MEARPIWRVALVGAGRVGTAVTQILAQAGHPIVGVSSRTRSSQEDAARRLSCPTFDFHSKVPETDVILVGAGDEALEEIAGALAPHLKRGTRLFHFAGSQGVAPFEIARSAGARVCATHPVQACPDIDTAVTRLPNSAWGITCAPEDVDWVEDLVVHDLHGHPLHVREEDRAVWHASSVMVSNGIAALLAIGESMIRSTGVDNPELVLSPLALGTVRNAHEGGGGGVTLTGPVVRGEKSVIERHVRALRERGLVEGYEQVLRMIVVAARQAGRIDGTSAETMMKLVGNR
ncbi:MAG: DUF2520 domain-containing protein [Actinomycetota bacterium]|nr:DUF2520 domain-containing protein [Actinomycetota bacterium]